MIIVGVAFRGASNRRLSERGWTVAPDLATAVINFNPTRPVGAVLVDIEPDDGTVTARIDAGPYPRTPADCRRWGVYGAHPTLALGYRDPAPGTPLVITVISLVYLNNDPEIPLWTVED